MIREKAVVVEVKGAGVRVATSAAAHERCGSCGLCRLAEGGKQMLLDVHAAPEGLRVGDEVVVEIPVPSAGRSAVILLVVPLVLFMAGIAVGEWVRGGRSVQGGSLVSVVVGLGLMALWYFGAALYDRHLQRSPEHQPRIVEWPGRTIDD